MQTKLAIQAVERLVDGFCADTTFVFDYDYHNRQRIRGSDVGMTLTLRQSRGGAFSAMPVHDWAINRALLRHILETAQDRSLNALAATVRGTSFTRADPREDIAYVRHELHIPQGVSIELVGGRRWTAKDPARLPVRGSLVSSPSADGKAPPVFELKVRLPEGEFAVKSLPPKGVAVLVDECHLAGCGHERRR